MNVDESGAPWPYEPIEPVEEPGVPTWECPDGTCECQSHQGEAARIDHTIVFFDADSKRMAGARCRVLENGELVNIAHPYADAQGAVPLKVRPRTRVLELEWAPAELPIRPDLPFRTRYYLDLGETPEEALHRRLHNVGFSWEDTDERNLLAFGRAYGGDRATDLRSLNEQLRAFHDDGTPPGRRAPRATVSTETLGLEPVQNVNLDPAPPLGGGVIPQGSAAPQYVVYYQDPEDTGYRRWGVSTKFPIEDGNMVTPYINGASAFDQMALDFETAKNEKDAIYLVGFETSPDTPMGGSTLADLLTAAAGRKVMVRGIFNGDGTRRFLKAAGLPFDVKDNAPLHNHILGLKSLPAQAPLGAACFSFMDDHCGVAGAHHQKIVVIKGQGGAGRILRWYRPREGSSQSRELARRPLPPGRAGGLPPLSDIRRALGGQ